MFPTQVSNGDTMGEITFVGRENGGSYLPGATIRAEALEDWTGTGNAGTALSFQATIFNTGTQQEVMRLENGNVRVSGDLQMTVGADRNISIPTNGGGPGNSMHLAAGSTAFGNSNGGFLNLNAGAANGTGVGGDVVLRAGAGFATGTIGRVRIVGDNTNPSSLVLENENGTGSVGFRATASGTTNVTYTLPDGDGTNGQLLSTNGSGVLDWTNPSGFTAPTFDDADNTIFGAAATPIPVPAGNSQLGVMVDGAAAGQATLSAISFQNRSQLLLIRAQGTEVGGGGALGAADQVIGDMGFAGHDGTSYSLPQASIQGVTTQLWTGANKGTALSFRGTPFNSNTSEEMMRLEDNALTVRGEATQARVDVISAGTPSQMNLTYANGTLSSPSLINGGQRMGEVQFIANYDGVNYAPGARISADATQAWALNTYGSRLVFSTTPDGTNSPIPQMIIENNGNIELSSGSDKAIRIPTQATLGRNLDVEAGGSSALDGGNLNLRSGSSAAGNGGSIRLHPGTGTGTDGGIDMRGITRFGQISGGAGTIELETNGGGNGVIINNSADGNYNLVLPPAQGAIGQALIDTDGFGTLGWANPTAFAMPFFDNGTELTFGSTGAAAALPLPGTYNLGLEVEGGAGQSVLFASSFQASSRLDLISANGDQITPSAVPNGSRIAEINFGGYNGASYVPTASIYAEAEQPGGFSGGAVGTRLRFLITPQGDPAPVEAMILSDDGANISLDVGGGAVVLQDDGTIIGGNIDGNNVDATNTLSGGDLDIAGSAFLVAPDGSTDIVMTSPGDVLEVTHSGGTNVGHGILVDMNSSTGGGAGLRVQNVGSGPAISSDGDISISGSITATTGGAFTGGLFSGILNQFQVANDGATSIDKSVAGDVLRVTHAGGALVGHGVRVDMAGTTGGGSGLAFVNINAVANAIDIGGSTLIQADGTYATTNGDITTVNGDFGVGTATPGAKLDVNGDARIVADLTLDGNLISGTTGPFNANPYASDTRIITVNGGPVDDIAPGFNGQELIIKAVVDDILVRDLNNGGMNIQLASNSSLYLNTDETLHMISDGTNWVEVSNTAKAKFNAVTTLSGVDFPYPVGNSEHLIVIETGAGIGAIDLPDASNPDTNGREIIVISSDTDLVDVRAFAGDMIFSGGAPVTQIQVRAMGGAVFGAATLVQASPGLWVVTNTATN